VEVGIGRMQVETTFEAESEERAVFLATMTSCGPSAAARRGVEVVRARQR
jgi:hypothetical protein